MYGSIYVYAKKSIFITLYKNTTQKTCLEKYFIMDKDYKILLSQSREQVKEQHGDHNKQTILLNVTTKW